MPAIVPTDSVTNLGLMHQVRTATPPSLALGELEAPHLQWARGVLSVCRITGTEPAQAIRPTGSGGDERIHCTLIWWLVSGLNLHPLSVGRWMGQPPGAIGRALNRMPSLAKMDPAVSDWMQRLQRNHSLRLRADSIHPTDGDAVFMETSDIDRKMGMAALWMTVETGMQPLALWGPEMVTKEAGKWATLWWLFAAKDLTHSEICTTLGIHPREALRLLNRLTHLAATRPDVFDWMASVRNTTPAAATT